MTDNLWRETGIIEPEQRESESEAGIAGAARPDVRGRFRRQGFSNRVADDARGDPWLACDAGTHDSTAPRLLLAATRCLIVAQLDPRAVEDDVTALLGASHRRVTILLRTLLCEMALHARKRIAIGSPCRPRPTEDESRLLEIVAAASAGATPAAHAQAAILLGGGATDRVVPLAAALGEAMRDAGLPMRSTDRTVH